MVTDKMVGAARAAYSTATGCNDTPHVLDGWIGGALRAALEAALSASDAEPVGHVSREDLADLQSGGCGIVVKLPQGEGEVPLFTAPPAVAVKAFNIDDLAQEIRRIDGENSLGAGSLAEALMPFIRTALVSPADTSPVIPEGWQLVPVKPTNEMAYAAACAHYGKALVDQTGVEGISMTVEGVDYSFPRAFRKFWKGALAAAPKEASHE